MKKYIEVVKIGGEVIKRIDVTGKSDRAIAQCEMGMLRNMDLENYSTQVVESAAPAPAKEAP